MPFAGILIHSILTLHSQLFAMTLHVNFQLNLKEKLSLLF